MRDYRLKFTSCGKNSFLQLVKENKEELNYFMNKLNSENKPKTK